MICGAFNYGTITRLEASKGHVPLIVKMVVECDEEDGKHSLQIDLHDLIYLIPIDTLFELVQTLPLQVRRAD